MRYLLVILLVFKLHSTSDAFDLSDIGKSVSDVTTGVINKIPDIIPNPQDIFESGKNLIAGYPFQQVNFNSNLLLEFLHLFRS